MAPIDVKYGWFDQTLTEQGQRTSIPDTDYKVEWGGDDNSKKEGGKAKVYKNNNKVGEFNLQNEGDTASFSLRVEVPAIEFGEKPTVVKRDILIKRTK